MLSRIFFKIFSGFRIRALVIYNDQPVWHPGLLNPGEKGIKIFQPIIYRYDHVYHLLIHSLGIILSHTAHMTLFEVSEISHTPGILNS